MLVSLMQSTPLRGLVYRLRVLSFGPPLVAFAVLYLFAVVPQMREVYLGIIETPDFLRGGLGLMFVALLCSLIYTWHYWVATNTINYVYPQHADLDLDLGLMSWRNGKALICACGPLIGLVVGLAALALTAKAASGRVDVILTYFGEVDLANEFESTRRFLSQLSYFLRLAVPLIFLAIVLMHALLRQAALGHRLRVATLWTAATTTGFITLFPLLAPDFVVPVFRLLGPLATIAMALVAIASTLMLFSWVLRHFEPSFIGAAFVGVILLSALYVLYHSLPLDEISGLKSFSPAEASDDAGGRKAKATKEDLLKKKNKEVEDKFKAWLEARGDKAAYQGRPYPVFIVATQGGGIYAASAAASFLASLEDDRSAFAQHVFAISGVSGGAVGASVFNAVYKAPTGQGTVPRGCRGLGRPTLLEQSRCIIEADHLSPVVALIAPDLLRKLPFLNLWESRFNRSSVLERSFACSFDSEVGSPKSGWLNRCGPANGADGLRIDYQRHWAPSDPSPAVVLNATWSETGFRVAFAPFPLQTLGDGTLYAFSDLPLKSSTASRSLIEAAFVSARFPGIVPAWRPGRDDRAEGEFNFVDGGYVDNSGATTALDIYKMIERMTERASVDLRLVLLTDARTDFDSKKIEGGGGADIVAPAAALLNVRSQLSQRAVTQAFEYVSRRQPGRPASGAAADDHVLTVDLEQQTFPLPLGWKISGVTNDVVRMMMGRPDLCRPAEELSRKLAAKEYESVRSYIYTINKNSCVKKTIIEILKAGN